LDKLTLKLHYINILNNQYKTFSMRKFRLGYDKTLRESYRSIPYSKFDLNLTYCLIEVFYPLESKLKT